MKNRNYRQGEKMTNEDRQLIVETLGEMRVLNGEMGELKGELNGFKGEMKEFKEHVIGRVQNLEKKEGERGGERLSVLSVIIASLSVVVNIIVNFFRGR